VKHDGQVDYGSRPRKGRKVGGVDAGTLFARGLGWKALDASVFVDDHVGVLEAFRLDVASG
jgi:hypothetical protein